MTALYLVLVLLAVICMVTAAIIAWRQRPASVNLALAALAVGLALWALVDLIRLIRAVR